MSDKIRRKINKIVDILEEEKRIRKTQQQRKKERKNEKGNLNGEIDIGERNSIDKRDWGKERWKEREIYIQREEQRYRGG